MISVPASIDMQLDGSAVKLKDYLSKADRKALENAPDAEHVMVNYRFDAMPRALQVAVPYTYDNTLFEYEADKVRPPASEQGQSVEETAQDDRQRSTAEQQVLEHIDTLLDNGRKVQIVGAVPNPAKKDTYIIAGGTPKRSTSEIKPVAVYIDDNTTIIGRTGEHLPPSIANQLQEGGEIVVEGKQSKRGVIHAKRMVVV